MIGLIRSIEAKLNIITAENNAYLLVKHTRKTNLV